MFHTGMASCARIFLSYSVAVQSSQGAAAGVDRARGPEAESSRERDDDRLHVRRALIIKKSSIFTGSRKIAKNQGKFRWVIKESSVAGLAGMRSCGVEISSTRN